MGRCTQFIIIFLAVLLITPSVLALDSTRLVSNSESWEDVYSTMLYSSLEGIEGYFLTSAAHGPVLLNAIPSPERVGIITSRDNPFVFDYPSIVNSRGYASVEELVVDSANLELVPELSTPIRKFIVVDNSYGYNAIAVTPYAIQTRSWVILADRANIAEIEALLDQNGVDDLLIYGYVEQEVEEGLARFNPRTINTGDRFQDNVEIVKEYKKIKETKQILLSNGEFIERELMSGNHPVIFTGRDNVPDQIAAYLKESDITIGVLVGNELINAATNIRRTTGLSVMVKFAQGARSQVAGISAVEGLDLFYLPTPTLGLEIYSIKYNSATSNVEITYHSTSNVPVYLKGTVTILSGTDRAVAGDLEAIFIAPGDYKTLVYPDFTLEGVGLQAEVVTLFGEVATALDRRLQGTFDLTTINVLDKCEIEVDYLKYNIQRETFVAGVKNLGDTDCYVDIELEDVRINRIDTTLGTEGSQLVKAGKRARIEIDQRMTEEDLDDNQQIDLVAYYGEREESLVNIFRGKFELDIDRYTTMTYAIAIVILLIILLTIWFFILRRRNRDDDWW